MRRTIAFVIAGAGLAITATAIGVQPWSHFGDFGVPLIAFPTASAYLVPAVVLQLVVGSMLLFNGRVGSGRLPRRLLRGVGVAAATVSAVSAWAVMTQYDNQVALFGAPDVQRILPELGAGGPLAIAGALISAVAVVIAPAHGLAIPGVGVRGLASQWPQGVGV